MARKKQSALILLGIVIGTGAYVTISGLMLGFQEFIIDQLVNNDAQIRITARQSAITEHSLDDLFYPESAHVFWKIPPSGFRNNNYIIDPQSWFTRLDSAPEVMAYAPQLSTQVIFKRGATTTTGQLRGTDPVKQRLVTNIEKYMVDGSFAEIGHGGNRIVAGVDLLKKLGALVNETLLVSSGANTNMPMKVVGSFRLGVKALDESTVFASIADVQKINKTPNRISDIAVKLFDVTNARDLADQWASTSQEKVQSWDQANENIMSVFKTQDIVRNFMTISIIIVAGFGIYNILSIVVNQKRREIAILRSLGFNSFQVTQTFFLQGLFLGIVGGLLGIFVGNLVCRYLETIEVSPGRAIGFGNRMVVSFNQFIYLRAILLSSLISLLSSILPARAAGKMTPIDIIRSESS